jgi:thiamine biosynthesis lipoprotein
VTETAVQPARRAFPALGTGAVVLTADPAALDRAVEVVRHQIDLVDRACSRFRPDSDLSRVNEAGARPVVVGPVLLAALDVALGAARDTDGSVDPTVGQALVLLGYDRDFAAVTDGPPVTRVTGVPGWRTVRVDRLASTVCVRPGVRVDLGATAKAFAADRAAAAAAAATGTGVLVSLGGDIACAGPAPEDGWLIRVTEDHAAGPSGEGQTIVIRDGGLATSSTTVRRWRRGGIELHHLVDPVTGRSVDARWRTVTVAAATCVQANVATTATIVKGVHGFDWLAAQQVPARLVALDGSVVRLGGWPEDDA